MTSAPLHFLHETTLLSKHLTVHIDLLPSLWVVPIFHDDILQPEIPHVTQPYIDDIPVRGPASRYIQSDGEPETIPENSGIRRFVWEHFQDLNRVVQQMKYCGGTFSGYKSFLCAPEITVLGHRCTIDERLPEQSRVDKIIKWAPCRDQSDVRAFHYRSMQAIHQELCTPCAPPNKNLPGRELNGRSANNSSTRCRISRSHSWPLQLSDQLTMNQAHQLLYPSTPLTSHRDPTLYRMVRFSERIHCTESVEFTGPLEPVDLDHFEYY